jgi:hypothetical protein
MIPMVLVAFAALTSPGSSDCGYTTTGKPISVSTEIDQIDVGRNSNLDEVILSTDGATPICVDLSDLTIESPEGAVDFADQGPVLIRSGQIFELVEDLPLSGDLNLARK